MAKKTLAGLPAGFKSFAGGSDGRTWEPAVGDVLQGKVVGKKTLDAKKVGRQNAKAGDKVTILSVANDDGEIFAVWESHALSQVCQAAKVGQTIFLRLDAIKKSGKKRFKDFTAGLK